MAIPRDQWSFYEWILTSEFEVHLDLLDSMDQGLDETLRNVQENLRWAVSSAKDEEEYQEQYAMLNAEEARGEEFESILFNSLFSASFALFEHKLSAICNQAQQVAGNPFSADDIRGRNRIDSARRYLEALGIKFPVQGAEWQGITSYQEIRNKIMHEGAALPESGNLVEYANKHQIASSWSGKELELTRSFCKEAVSNLEQFIIKVSRAYNAWCERTD